MSRRIAALAGLAVVLSAPALAAEREVTIAGGAVTLHATLQTPDKPATRTAVLILAGSGPTDRDGNAPSAAVHPNTYRMLAQGLADQGVATLRPDKRLIGASRSPDVQEAGVTLDDYVADAVAWGRYLAAQPGVGCVVVLGHSEGALVGALAANRIPACGLVSVSGEGRPLDAVIMEQLKAAGLPPDLLAQAMRTLDDLKQGRRVDDYPPSLAVLFRASVQPFLISELQKDPTKAIAEVKAPVLIVQGDHDIQIGVPDAERLKAAHPDAELVVVAGMNHVLKPAPADRAGNVATYADPNLPLAQDVVPAVARFVKRVSS